MYLFTFYTWPNFNIKIYGTEKNFGWGNFFIKKPTCTLKMNNLTQFLLPKNSNLRFLNFEIF